MRQKMNSAEAVGVAVHSARKARDVSGARLAEQISEILGENYSANTVSKIENGYREVTISELRAIAKALQWPFEWLTTPPFPTEVWSDDLGGSLIVDLVTDPLAA